MTDKEAYKEFVDQLVGLSDSQAARRVEQGLWQRVDDSKNKRPKFAALAEMTDRFQSEVVARNGVLASLDQRQRSEIAKIVTEERTGAIHDFLAFLHDSGYRLSRDGVSFELGLFGTEPHYDYVARLNGDKWPDSSKR